MTSTCLRWAVALVFCCSALAGCSDDDEPTSEPTSTAPTGSPFSATLEGPDVAAPGDQLTATLTNTGRLPDKYLFKPDPQDAATVTPLEVGLGPGESAEVTIDVAASPVVIRVESIGGSAGVTVTELNVGAEQ